MAIGAASMRVSALAQASVSHAVNVDRLPSLRASDSDRDEVVERLRHATAEGRLSADELEERLEALFACRTYGELDSLVADLPVSRSPDLAHLRVPRWAVPAATATLLVMLFGMVASAVRHSTEAVAVAPHPRVLRVPGLVDAPHHDPIVAMAGVFAVVAACVAAALWLRMRSRTSRP